MAMAGAERYDDDINPPEFYLAHQRQFMSVLLFKLYNVPEDEASDVRQLLEEHGFGIYETQAGFFGLGVAAIWLHDASELAQAREVIDHYQAERSQEQRTRFAEQKARGEVPSMLQKMAENPLQAAATVAVIAVVALVSLVPIWILVSP